MLHPMSLKDAIWINVALNLLQKQEHEFQFEKDKAILESLKSIYLLSMDIREICRDTNYVQKAKAMGKKAKEINIKDLPSEVYKKQQEQEEFNKLSEEEKIAIKVAEFQRKLDQRKGNKT